MGRDQKKADFNFDGDCMNNEMEILSCVLVHNNNTNKIPPNMYLPKFTTLQRYATLEIDPRLELDGIQVLLNSDDYMEIMALYNFVLSILKIV